MWYNPFCETNGRENDAMIDEIIRHYDALANSGNDPVSDPPELCAYMDKWDGRTFLDMLELSPIQSVLEIGCGTGRLAVRVAPAVRSFCGIDVSPESVRLARTHLASGNVRLVCADFLRCDFSEKFNLIYSSLTFMHIRDKETAIGKVFSLLETGGRFVLSIDKSRDSRLDFGAYSIEIYPDNPEETLLLLGKCGFADVKRQETEFAYLFSAVKCFG